MANQMIQRLLEDQEQARIKRAIQKNRDIEKKQLSRVYDQIPKPTYGLAGIKEMF